MIEIIEEDISFENLKLYESIPSSYVVESRIVLDGLGIGKKEESNDLTEIPEEPWAKDYDLIDGQGPSRWASQFDISNWGLLYAWGEDRRVGGAVIAWQSESVFMLEGRKDLAVIFDIRVHPRRRRMGIGKSLFVEASRWAKSRGCTNMKIETQDVNVSACRFYAAMGCELGAINRGVYPSLPDETQFLWYKKL